MLQFYLEPRQTIQRLVAEKKLTAGDFITLAHGQTVTVEDGKSSIS